MPLYAPARTDKLVLTGQGTAFLSCDRPGERGFWSAHQLIPQRNQSLADNRPRIADALNGYVPGGAGYPGIILIGQDIVEQLFFTEQRACLFFMFHPRDPACHDRVYHLIALSVGKSYRLPGIARQENCLIPDWRCSSGRLPVRVAGLTSFPYDAIPYDSFLTCLASA